jgi:GLPGLI family protein
MKTKFLIFLILPCLLIGQAKNICLEYGVTINDEVNLFKDFPAGRVLFENAMKDDEKLIFKLFISKNETIFFIDKELSMENYPKSDGFLFAVCSFSGSVFTHNDKIYKKHFLLGNKIIQVSDKKSNWILENETKIIDNNLCFKASNTNVVKNGDKVFNHKVVAWYCPKIPYSHGPNGYGNLPGLILELQVRNVVFGLKKIDYKCENEVNNSFLDKLEAKSEEEIKEIYEKMR